MTDRHDASNDAPAPGQPEERPIKPVKLPPINRAPLADRSNAAYSALTPKPTATERAEPASKRGSHLAFVPYADAAKTARVAQADQSGAADRGAAAGDVDAGGASTPESGSGRGRLAWIIAAAIALVAAGIAVAFFATM